MPSSAPGMGGSIGRPPVAMTMCRAVSVRPPTASACGPDEACAARGPARPCRSRGYARRCRSAARCRRRACVLSVRQSWPSSVDMEAVLRRVSQRIGDVRGVPHHLLRHAAHVDAGAAEPAGLHHHGPRAVRRRAPGARDARRCRRRSPPDRSRTSPCTAMLRPHRYMAGRHGPSYMPPLGPIRMRPS